MNKFDIRNVIDMYPQAFRFSIIGRRKSGKSFSCKCEIIDNFLLTDKIFCYVARRKEDLKEKIIGNFFVDVLAKASENYKKLLNQKFGVSHANIVFFKGSYWIVDQNPDTGKNNYLALFGITASLKDPEGFKRRTFNDNCDRVLVDECITAQGYVEDEPGALQKIIDTICRTDEVTATIRVYLCGNPDYDIEQCPHFTKYNLNYAKIELNSILTYDTKIGNNIVKNNEIFCKVASEEDSEEGLFNRTSGVFSINETRSSVSGEVKHGDYNIINIKEWMEEVDFTPLTTIVQDTAVEIKDGYLKKIYCTLGCAGKIKVPTIVIHRHDIFKRTNHIDSCYFEPKYFPNNYLFRCNLTNFPRVAKYMNTALAYTNVFTEDPSIAQTFFNIRKEGLKLPW